MQPVVVKLAVAKIRKAKKIREETEDIQIEDIQCMICSTKIICSTKNRLVNLQENYSNPEDCIQLPSIHQPVEYEFLNDQEDAVCEQSLITALSMEAKRTVFMIIMCACLTIGQMFGSINGYYSVYLYIFFVSWSVLVLFVSAFGMLPFRNVVNLGVFLLACLIGFVSIQMCIPSAAQHAWFDSLNSVRKNSTLKKDAQNKDVVVNVEGVVMSTPQHTKPGEMRFVLKIEDHSNSHGAVLMISAPNVPWLDYAKMQARSRIVVSASVRPTYQDKCSLTQYLFSYDAYLYRRGIIAQGRVNSLNVISLSRDNPPLRDTLAERIMERFASYEATSLVLATTIGTGDLMSYSLNESFRKLGLSHLIVISGFHIGLVSFAVHRIIRWMIGWSTFVTVRVPMAIPSAILSFIACSAYVWLVRGGIPSIRALCALAVFGGSQILCRRSDAYRALAATYCMCALLSPGGVFEMGFELTFAALCGLYLGTYSMRVLGARVSFIQKCGLRMSVRVKNVMTTICSTILLCIGAWIFTTPVLVMWTAEIVPCSVVVNILLVSIYGLFVVLGGSVAVVLLYLDAPISENIFRVLLWGVDLLITFVLRAEELAMELDVGCTEIPDVWCPYVFVMFVVVIIGWIIGLRRLETL